jgi:hypothetical protein
VECLGGSLCFVMVCSGSGDASDEGLDGFEVVGVVFVVLDEMSACVVSLANKELLMQLVESLLEARSLFQPARQAGRQLRTCTYMLCSRSAPTTIVTTFTSGEIGSRPGQALSI